MQIYPYKSEQRLNEANLCLERIRSASNSYEIKQAFISFLNASRFALDPLKVDYNDLEAFRDWWSKKGEFLNKNSLCVFFRKLRNDIIKGGKNPFSISQTIKGPTVLRGPVQIGPEGILKGSIEGNRMKWNPISVPNTTTVIRLHGVPEEFNGGDLINLCQKYLNILKEIVDEFVLNFGSNK